MEKEIVDTLKLNKKLSMLIKSQLSTQEFVKSLENLGFKANFFSLKGKGYDLLRMKEEMKYEESMISRDPFFLK